ncbi:kinase-like protein [Byssothecium circinans]|uniref:non-specific serine/threonine protein kinase n=1 Tax=Byssothecium circinans TaxID=147558 RepID=A0A6A5T8E5_9PLEO|nr:kinase-like protein [Byssothecium circinans]
MSTDNVFATPSDRLASFFDPSQPREAFNDAEIDEISNLLGLCSHAASRCPRTYIVLRAIGEDQLLDRLLDEGFNDQWFPVQSQGLPHFLSPSVKARIIQAQEKILTKSLGVENGRHSHFKPDDALPFNILSRLGSGGYGQVDRIESRISFRHYALKRIRRRAAFGVNSRESMKRFLAEIQIIKRLQHRHVIEYIGSYTDKTYLGLIMSPVAEMDLAALLDQISAHVEAGSFRTANSSTSWLHEQALATEMCATLRTFYGCLAAALAYLHDRSVRHKDIKPQNILIHRGSVLLTDFGLSRDFADDIGSTTSGLTATTPRYCSPEVASFEARNTSADIWSLGCVFFEMSAALRGYNIEWIKRYFAANSSKSTHFHANHEAYSQLVSEWEAIDDPKDSIPLRWIRKMLSKDQHLRPNTATLLAEITCPEEMEYAPTAFCGICCIPDDASDTEDSLADMSIMDVPCSCRPVDTSGNNMIIRDQPSLPEDKTITLTTALSAFSFSESSGPVSKNSIPVAPSDESLDRASVATVSSLAQDQMMNVDPATFEAIVGANLHYRRSQGALNSQHYAPPLSRVDSERRGSAVKVNRRSRDHDIIREIRARLSIPAKRFRLLDQVDSNGSAVPPIDSAPQKYAAYLHADSNDRSVPLHDSKTSLSTPTKQRSLYSILPRQPLHKTPGRQPESSWTSTSSLYPSRRTTLAPQLLRDSKAPKLRLDENTITSQTVSSSNASQTEKVFSIPFSELPPRALTSGISKYGSVPVIVQKCCEYLQSRASANGPNALVTVTYSHTKLLVDRFHLSPDFGSTLDWSTISASFGDVAEVLRSYLDSVPGFLSHEAIASCFLEDRTGPTTDALYTVWYEIALTGRAPMEYAITMNLLDTFQHMIHVCRIPAEDIAMLYCGVFFQKFFDVCGFEDLVIGERERQKWLLTRWITRHHSFVKMVANKGEGIECSDVAAGLNGAVEALNVP